MEQTIRLQIGLVAFAVLFSTVVPVTVSAEDTVMISNDVRSSSNTGGLNGTDGVAGQDGQDGQDGQAGQDGSDGTSGTASAGASVSNVISGNSSQTVRRVTTTAGEATIEIDQTGPGTTTLATTVSASSMSEVATQEVTETDTSESNSSHSRLTELLQSLKSVLTAYVQSLF